MSSILEADSIRKSFGDKQVLTDVFISCHTGDITGLLGRNGSGKSTLMKILFGSLNPDQCFIKYNGEQITRPFTRKGLISYLHQDNFLPQNMTVRKVITLFGERLNSKNIEEDQLINNLLKNRIKTLSGGELRYLEVMLILNTESDFILLDEPFNGLSPIQTGLVKDNIKRQSANKGIILTDHDYNNVLEVANKYAVLYDGGYKILKSKEEFIEWGYLPDNEKITNH
jgi:lipopolysaccharide export system ATP-binding protein